MCFETESRMPSNGARHPNVQYMRSRLLEAKRLCIADIGSEFGTPYDLSYRVIALQRNHCDGRSVGEARCILWLALVRTAAQRQFRRAVAGRRAGCNRKNWTS